MVKAAKDSGFFQAQDIHRAFHHADEGSITPGIITKNARLLFCKSAANIAELNLLARGQEVLREPLHCFLFGLNKVQGDALRRARPDPWKFRKRGNELIDRFGKRRHKIYINPGMLNP